MLSVDPSSSLRSPARRKPQLSPSRNNNTSAPFQDNTCDAVFPVENVLLQNALSSAERESGNAAKQITYEKRQKLAASASSHDDEEVNLHATLHRKQQIVESLQRAVQSFQLEKDAILVECARNLAKKVP